MRRLLALLLILCVSGVGSAFSAGLDSDVVFLSHYNGADGDTTATDVSDSAHSITFEGNAELDTAIKKFGTASLILDGTNDFTSSPDSDDWDLLPTGAEIFTIDLQVYFSGTGTRGIISAHGANSTDDGWAFWLNGNTLEFVYNGGAIKLFQYAWTPNIGQWYHLAVEKWDADDWSLYIDGTEVDTAVETTAILDDTALTLRVGAQYTYSSGPWRWNSSIIYELYGNIDEPRISKGVARYGGEDFTPPTEEYSRSQAQTIMVITNY